MADIKNVIKREYLKCAQDPVYFMRKYCTIQHPKKGKMKFDLYEFDIYHFESGMDFLKNEFFVKKLHQLKKTIICLSHLLEVMIWQWE